MRKRDVSVYQVSSEYADCLERSFQPSGVSSPEAVSGGGETRTAGFLGAMGNTPLSSRHLGEISEDTVHLSLWVEWGAEREILFDRLRHCQYEARHHAENYLAEEEIPSSGMELDFDPEKAEYEDMATCVLVGDRFIEGHGKGYIEFGGSLWKVLCHGLGGKDGRSYYPFAMVGGGVTIGLRRDGHETVSNMWVEIGSIPLALHGGLGGIWQILEGILRKEGVQVIRDLVSRVDIYADFDLCSVEEFCERFHNSCKVTRARKISQYGEDLNTATYLIGRRYTGFSIGGNIRLRCYDKRYELRTDPIKYGVFADRYNGIPEVLTRVEFQLRRVALKDFLVNGKDRIEGVKSYLAAREQLWRYLTEDWFRLTEEKVDAKNRHQSRARTWSIWEAVQSAVGGVVKEIFRHRRQVKIDMEHLYRMALGCICKIAVWEGEEVETAGDVLRLFVDKVKARGSRDFWDVMERHYEEKHLQYGHLPGAV